MCQGSLCARRWVQTHSILRLYHSAVPSLTLQPSLASPAVWALFLLLTLLISTLSNILPHFLQISSPPSLRYGSGIQEWLVGTLGIVAGGNNCDGCRVCQSSEPWHRYVGCQWWDLWSSFELRKVSFCRWNLCGGVHVCTCVHRHRVVRLSSSVNKPSFYIPAILFLIMKTSQLKPFIMFCWLNLHSSTAQLHVTMKPQKSLLPKKTAVIINHWHKKCIQNTLLYSMGCFLCLQGRTNKIWQENSLPCLTSRKLYLNI